MWPGQLEGEGDGMAHVVHPQFQSVDRLDGQPEDNRGAASLGDVRRAVSFFLTLKMNLLTYFRFGFRN